MAGVPARFEISNVDFPYRLSVPKTGRENYTRLVLWCLENIGPTHTRNHHVLAAWQANQDKVAWPDGDRAEWFAKETSTTHKFYFRSEDHLMMFKLFR